MATADEREEFLDAYEPRPPRAQHQLDLFAGQWTSKVPVEGEEATSGPRDDLFSDERLAWGLDQLGPLTGQRVLELGPLEGAHTWMLEKAGAGEVVGVEAHRQAFLRCLVVKNLLGLRARFELGDFVGYLRERSERWDLVVGSGVLYHMADPLELLALLGARTDRVFLWTHYYDAAVLEDRTDVAARFSGEQQVERDGFRATLHRYEYAEGAQAETFCGGSRPHAHWLERDAIIGALATHGLTEVMTAFDDPYWPHGPAFCLLATTPEAAPGETPDEARGARRGLRSLLRR